ncbi:hypothetical protein NL676_028038 [Syzygium grande]|nr:hypothetical protein NL676_028038 [Syzygium grande]
MTETAIWENETFQKCLSRNEPSCRSFSIADLVSVIVSKSIAPMTRSGAFQRPVRSVTTTNFCPPSYSKKKQFIWCNPPGKHFDLFMPMFTKIVYYKTRVIPLRYRRVSCSKQGGVKFEIKGNSYFTRVLIYNVDGTGDVIP